MTCGDNVHLLLVSTVGPPSLSTRCPRGRARHGASSSEEQRSSPNELLLGAPEFSPSAGQSLWRTPLSLVVAILSLTSITFLLTNPQLSNQPPTPNPPSTTQSAMRSFAYVACFLVAAAAGSPLEHAVRSFTDASQSASGSGATSDNTFSSTPWGTTATSSQSSYQHQQAQRVIQTLGPAFGTLGQMQGLISSSSSSQSYSQASSYTSQLVSQLQPALDAYNNCGCGDSPDIAPAFNQFFGQLGQVLSGYQSNFGGGFPRIIAPFNNIAPSFSSFVQHSQQSQSQSSSSITQSVAPVVNTLRPVLPAYGNLGF
ncbi:hypothetical protein PCANC_24487 [Puccinia coronata f. sp. avenae]|uniref:Uncharacterized protein n=1 Tax=Puccinia coronata f. sp. avenae TaxID=200324 RepID=A0A2N5S127_9BASI|nr:hypothetical protein PCANC_24487 [Puccinia coronata f. sp. avenae]